GIPHQDSPVSSHITVSFGIATVKPLPGQDNQVLLKLADEALYQAKDKGRNQYAYLTKKKKEIK
ncbi:MAG: diguanylate cyclase domain-containing protein, partial [Microcystaceae cyanobacterium]